jgi:ankyrin repeat protein
LLAASLHRHCDVVKCLLSSGADINFRDICGQSPLCVVSCHGYCDIVKCLLTSGADINFRDKGGQTPFYVAASGGYYDIVIFTEIDICTRTK